MHLNWRLGGSYLRMEVLNWVCFLLCLPSISESCLDGTIDRLIYGENHRVPNRLFKADSFDGIFTPQQARLEGFSWCSSSGLIESDRPWLQVTFEMDVNISIIQTGGYGGYIVRLFYVTKFEVSVGDTEEGLHPLTISDDSTQPMVFERMRTSEVRNTVLPSPVTTKVLRIVAVEWNRDQACLRLEALGCPTNSGTASTTVPITATKPSTEASSLSPIDQFKAAIVGGAVGAGLGLLLLLLAIVVAFILILTRRKRVVCRKGSGCEDSVEDPTMTCTTDTEWNTKSKDNKVVNSGEIVGNECCGIHSSLNKQNERLAISDNKGSGCGDSMNSRSTCSTNVKQNTKSIDKVDNPGASCIDIVGNECYGIQNKPNESLACNPTARCIEIVGNECYGICSSQNKPNESLACNPAASCIEIVGNECYGICSSQNKRLACNPTASCIEIVGNECYGISSSQNKQDESRVVHDNKGSGFGDMGDGYYVLPMTSSLADVKLSLSESNQEPSLDYYEIK